MTFRLFQSMIVISTLMFASSTTLAQSTWHVDVANCPGPGSGVVADPFCKIQDGINAAINGDIVLVSQGVYLECVDFIGKDISLRSISGSEVTIIDGTGLNCSVVKCNNGILNGFTLTGGSGTPGPFCCSYGGGVYNGGGNPTVTNCIFKGNKAVYGAGIFDWGGGTSVSHCTFIGNYTIGPSSWIPSGGGIGGSYDSQTKIDACIFMNNTAWFGGGIAPSSSGSMIATNCLFINNTASHGGAIGVWKESDLTITNSSFFGNTGNGNAIACNSPSQLFPSTAVLSNCILWDGGFEVSNIDGSTITIEYSTVQGGWSAGIANIVADPMFVDPDGPDNIAGTEDDNLRLMFGSPCIDKGDNSVVTESTDLDGNPRIVDGDGDSIAVVDMGAYEKQALKIWYVDDDKCPDPGSGVLVDPFCSIQDGIDAASDTDTVLVSPGTYNEVINFLGKAITLRSTDGPDVTTINGTGGQVVFCISGEANDTVLNGFTITGGNTGGGGGGMRNNNSSPTVMNCNFVGNTASSGGGMLNTNGNPIIINCMFVSNSAGVGGGMHNENSSPTVTNCTFLRNTATFGGGGMRNIPGSSPTVTNCKFIENTAKAGGGMYNVPNSSPVLVNCLFSGNVATGVSSSSGGGGGGIHNETDSDPAVLNCTFVGNESTGGGPGGGMFSFDSNPTVVNSIFWANSDGGGMDESAQIHHAGTGTSTVTYSCIQGLDTFAGNGNISERPYFISDGADGILGTEDDDLRLESISPCIDAGNNSDVTESTDLDGNPRIVDGDGDSIAIVDMGAYEFHENSLWTLRTLDGPSSRELTMMVYDSCRDVTVLYGGANFTTSPATFFSETWEWDGVTWNLRSIAGPSVYGSMGMAFDSMRCATVLFGGNDDAGSYFNETWEWDGNIWTQKFPSTNPAPRAGPGMTFNNIRGKTLMFGGWSPGYLNDLWQWDGTNWVAVSTAADKPSPRSGASMAYDFSRDRTVLFGGSLVAASCGTRSDETWELNTSVSPAIWSLVTTAVHPAPRENAPMVYDSARNTMVLFGGRDCAPTMLGDTWERHANIWTQTSTTGPAARYRCDMAFDIARAEAVLFGGLTSEKPDERNLDEFVKGDTWTYGERPPLLCGDGVIDMGEECDDGNNLDFDGCSATCIVELFGCNGLWRSEPSLIVGRQRARACTDDNGNIYVVGGSSNITLSSLEMLPYSGTSYGNAWVNLPNMPKPRRNLAVVCAGNFIYAIGGSTDVESETASVDRFDIANDIWTSDIVPDMNMPRNLLAATKDQLGRIWVVGGLSAGAIEVNTVEIYDPAQPKLGWQTGPALNVSRAGHSVVADSYGKLYAIGGMQISGVLDSIERIDPQLLGASWELLTAKLPGPVSNTDLAVTGADGLIYILGGYLPGFTNRVLQFDSSSQTFSNCSTMSESLNHVASTLGADGRIYRIGGEPDFFVGSSFVESLPTINMLCGNGILESGEECDDSGETSTCDIDCTFVECGDGVLNQTAGEECDDGDCCSSACTIKPAGTICRDPIDLCDPVEVCDGVSNPCPDDITNRVCDDNNLCTDDSCDPDEGCVFTPNDLNSCDDSNFCNGTEICSDGNCLSGSPVVCINGQVCDPSDGICKECVSDADCDNEPFCNGVETCDNSTSTCLIGSPIDCAALDPTRPLCDNARSACVECIDVNDCDDLFCTGTETCNFLGTCISGDDPCPNQLCDENTDSCIDCITNSDCNDGNPCTTDVCNVGICEIAPAQNGTVCRISTNVCNPAETCDGISTTCPVDEVHPTGTPCDNGDLCAGDTCQAGNCVDICNDNDVCTTDSCSDGVCFNDPISCEGGNECTVSACDPLIGCFTVPVMAGTPCGTANNCGGSVCEGVVCVSLCDDGVGCTVDSCDNASGSCLNDPTNVLCDDSNVCTVNICDLVLGCLSGPVQDGTNCGPANACGGFTCQNKTCTDACDDGIGCTADSCDIASSVCIHDLIHAVCDDGSVCTINTCDPINGCVAVAEPDGTFCNDNNACTQIDFCVVGRCAGTDSVDCSDPLFCTRDTCNPATGECSHVPDDSLCNDSAFCNGVATCDGLTGECPEGTPPCNDVTQICNEAYDSCVDICIVDADCDDGLFCNGDEGCWATETCRPGNAPCTNMLCDEIADICVPCLSNEDCDDGILCNGAETCDPVSGECGPGRSVDCNDALFCNGNEQCDLVADSCGNAPSPCELEICNETDDRCEAPCTSTDPTDSDGDGRVDECDNCVDQANIDQSDVDRDGVGDMCDNCEFTPNGPAQGTCVSVMFGEPCIDDGDCGTGGLCSVNQEDSDGDEVGDACDTDDDNDGWPDEGDNCPLRENPGVLCLNPLGCCTAALGQYWQVDTDCDGLGDVCDVCPTVPNNSLDSDGDGIPDDCDNCPTVVNPSQKNTDGDTYDPENPMTGGDACDDDLDGDGVLNDTDNCRTKFNLPAVSNGLPEGCAPAAGELWQEDSDCDGHGEVCDACPGSNDADDSDGDGIPDDCDNCPTVVNPSQTNTDGDTYDSSDPTTGGDACDDDLDGDGVPNDLDNCRTQFNPTEVSNGPPPDCAPESGEPWQEDSDCDGLGNICDPCRDIDQRLDRDCDGVEDAVDNCPRKSNPPVVSEGPPPDCASPAGELWQEDSDCDGAGDDCDQCLDTTGLDFDEDGVPDVCDNCPEDPNPNQADFDNDRIGDVCDQDDDDDGWPDANDNCRTIPNPNQLDSDNDDIGDCCDTDFTDTDEDGVNDICDNCRYIPNGPNQADIVGIGNQTDSDLDGIGDACKEGAYCQNDGSCLESCPSRNSCQSSEDCPDDTICVPFPEVTCLPGLCSCDNGLWICTDDCAPQCCGFELPGQDDNDKDGYGNACDNCPNIGNPNQTDDDLDNVGNDCDNCIDIPNSFQSNIDNDSNGDVCDPCPNDATDQCDDGGAGECTVIDGCCVKTNSGIIEICIPSGSLIEDTTISITQRSDRDEVDLIVGPTSGLGIAVATYDFEPEGITFNPSATITVKADVSDKNFNQRNNLKLYQYNDTENIFEPIPSSECTVSPNPPPPDTCDSISIPCIVTCTATITHFSEYGLIAPLDSDDDGIFDDFDGITDNCPTTYNPDQVDCNDDGDGDACVATVVSPQAEPVIINKNRYITLVPGNAGQQTGIRVKLTSLYHPDGIEISDFSEFENQFRWVGPPSVYQEGALAEPTFIGAELQCEPYFHDWGNVELLYVFGDAILPSSKYEVQMIQENCHATVEETSYSMPALTIVTARWGDVIEPFNPPSGSTQPNIDDVLALVGKWLGKLFPLTSMAQLQPNVPNPSTGVSIDDVLKSVNAWLSSPYPFDGPVSCP